MKGGIWIYGPLPEPNGGISVFLERLIESKQLPIEGVVDVSFGPKKSVAPLHLTANAPDVLSRAKALANLARLRHRPLFLNGSTARSVVAIAPFLAFRTAPTVLLLHHGDLNYGSRIWRIGLKLLLGRFDRIACLSMRQLEFYKAAGADPSRVELVDSYIPTSAGSDPPSARLDATLQWIRADRRPLVIGSGYAKEYYRHEWTLDALIRDDAPQFRYLLCCYGPMTAHLSHLEQRFAQNHSAKLVYGLGPGEFDRVLSEGNVYVRPSDVDSFGIATFDAFAKGLEIVASNACERPSGYIHEAGDKEDFIRKLDTAISAVSVSPKRSQRSFARSENRIHLVSFLRKALVDLQDDTK